MVSFHDQLCEIKAHLDLQDRRLKQLEITLGENTDLTRDMRDMLVAGKVMTKVIKWAGAIALAGSALYAAGYQILNGGKLPQ